MDARSQEPDAHEDPARCLAFALRRASRRVSATYDEVLRASGLRVTQFNLLVVLARTGALTMGRLAEHTATDRTTLTRNLAVLEDRGLVSLVVGTDRRQRVVTVTAQGRAAVDRAQPAWAQAQRSLVDSIGGDPTEVLAVLARLEDATEAPAPVRDDERRDSS